MVRRLLVALAVLAMAAVAGCSPVGEEPGASSDIRDSPCGTSFMYELLEPIPAKLAGTNIVPTHAVRAQAYACVGHGDKGGSPFQWEPIGGIASGYIDGISLDPRVVGGVVKTAAGAPWPYSSSSLRLPFQFPIAVLPGIQATITAGFDTIALDRGELLSCWLVEPDGHTVFGSRYNTVSTGALGRPTSVDCGGTIGETS